MYGSQSGEEIFVSPRNICAPESSVFCFLYRHGIKFTLGNINGNPVILLIHRQVVYSCFFSDAVFIGVAFYHGVLNNFLVFECFDIQCFGKSFCFGRKLCMGYENTLNYFSNIWIIYLVFYCCTK